jgi:hypothetical protein
VPGKNVFAKLRQNTVIYELQLEFRIIHEA